MTSRAITQSFASDPTIAILRADATLVQIADAAFADAARRSGPHLVCRPGCTQCCYGAFTVNALDALRLRTAMAELTIGNPAKAAAIAGRAHRFLAEYAESFPGNPTTGILDSDESAQDAFEEFANDVPCPALDPETGLCGVYEARPMTCRVFGPPVRSLNEEEGLAQEGLAVCELCFNEATEEEIAAAEMRVPEEQESALLQELSSHLAPSSRGETIVAYCLIETERQPAL